MKRIFICAISALWAALWLFQSRKKIEMPLLPAVCRAKRTERPAHKSLIEAYSLPSVPRNPFQDPSKMASKTEILAQIDSMRKELKKLKKLLKALPEEEVAAEKPKKKSRAKKDPSAPKKPLNAWQAWTVYAKETYPEQYKEFADELEEKGGVAPKFASYLRESAADEYNDFVAKYKAENPSAEKPKKPTTSSAKKAPAASAAASAAASSDSSDDEEGEEAGNQWVWKGKTYFRTEENECWYEQDGKMIWAGVYDPIADSMDADAEEPEVEFD